MMPENLASATSAECNRGKGETGPAAMCPHENTRAHLSLVALAASARVRLRLKKGTWEGSAAELWVPFPADDRTLPRLQTADSIGRQ
jgi:hypothetical protein